MRSTKVSNSVLAASRRQCAGATTTQFESLEDRTLWSASTLDASFNGTGGVATAFGSAAVFNSVVVLSDNKILAAGTVNNGTHKQDFLIARYNANGKLDTTFGGGTGRVFTDFSNHEDRGAKLLLTGGGKFAVIGTTSNSDGSASNFAVARYNANGTPDTGFSGDGKLTTDFSGAGDVAFTAAILSDGKLLVVGNSSNGAEGEPDVAFARYNTNGTLDTSFGGGTGKRLTDISGNPDYPTDVAVLPLGQILVTVDDGFELAQFTSSGALDKNFGGGDGWVRTPLAGVDTASALVVLNNGKILVGGTTGEASENTTFEDFAVARYNANGTLDTSFNGGWGFTSTSFDPNLNDDVRWHDNLRAISVQPDGKIVAVGTSDRDSSNGPLSSMLSIARYNASGTPDTSFSGDGRQSYSIIGGANANWPCCGATPRVVAGFLGSKAAIARFGTDSPATASISGNVYNDLNGNGAKNTGEGGLSGWQVFADSNNDGFYTPGETVATTDASGNYKISGLAPGTYRIREVRLTDFNRTQPAGAYPLGFYDVTLAVGQAVTGKNFGNKHV